MSAAREPSSGGKAPRHQRLNQESEGHKQRVVAIAEGDASRFKQVLTEYNKAPAVTRDRMYLETMQQVFSNTSKIYTDTKGSGSLLYLPLDKLMQQANVEAAAQRQAAAAPVAAPEPAARAPEQPAAAESATRPRDGLRGRDRP